LPPTSLTGADLADDRAHPTAALSVFEGRRGAVAISKCESIGKG